MIDLHCHVLSGIDDGPATVEQSLEVARAAAAAGTRTLVATPHVSWEYPNRSETIERLVNQLNGRLIADGTPLDITTGAEIAMTRVADTPPEELARLTLGGGKWLLVEPPFVPVISGLEALAADLAGRGFQVVLAHPERCQAFRRDRSMLERLVDSGVLTSITSGSLVGRFGGPVRRFSMDLVRDGLVHNVASDAHDPSRRSPSIAAEMRAVGLGPLAAWMTEDVPAAILAGDAIPRRPGLSIVKQQEDLRQRPRWLSRLRSAGRSDRRPPTVT